MKTDTKRITSKLSVLIVMLMAASLFTPVHAQHFEGEITIEIDNREEIQHATLFIRENRINIIGKLPGGAGDFPISGESVLIRSDQRDIIIPGKDNTAVQIRISEIENMIRMFSGGQKPEEAAQDLKQELEEQKENFTINETGNTRGIHGFTANQIIFTDNENPEKEVHAWLSEDIGIDWDGIFSAFSSLTETMGLDSFRQDYGWTADKTPLLLEGFENGNLDFRVQVTNINRRSLTKAEIDIPDGVRLISLFEMMMQSGQN